MSTIFDNLGDVLDIGYFGSRFGICCPDCQYNGTTSIHFLGNGVRFLQMFEGVGGCAMTGCCFNLYSTNETFLNIDEAVDLSSFFPDLSIEEVDGNILVTSTGETACENNDFYSCITSLSGLCDDFSVFLDAGIIEIGTLSGQSAICILKDYIINQSISPSDAQNLIDLFFDTSVNSKGMITFCEDDTIFIGSLESFLNINEALQLIVCPSPPPVP